MREELLVPPDQQDVIRRHFIDLFELTISAYDDFIKRPGIHVATPG
jgi:hypothetical protein